MKNLPTSNSFKSNYLRLEQIAPHIFDKRYSYQKMSTKDDVFMDLIIESCYRDTKETIDISIAYYFTQNGDLMCDSKMELRINLKSKTVEPLTYRLDSMGLYHQVHTVKDGKEMFNWNWHNELSRFLSEWLLNIDEQPKRVITNATYLDEKETEKYGQPTFDADGKEIDFDMTFNRDNKCDWCGRAVPTAWTSWGTTLYNRYICKECHDEINYNRELSDGYKNAIERDNKARKENDRKKKEGE